MPPMTLKSETPFRLQNSGYMTWEFFLNSDESAQWYSGKKTDQYVTEGGEYEVFFKTQLKNWFSP